MLNSVLELEVERGAPGLRDAGEQHDGAQCGFLFGHHRRDYRTLAVAEHREAVGPDLGPRAQIRKAGAHVLGEVGAGRALERATRCPCSTVVHAQHRDPSARQRIRELAEGPKPWQPDVLVAVLRPGSRDGDDRAHGFRAARTLGQSQRAGERVAGGRLHHHLFRGVGCVSRRGVVGLWFRRRRAYRCLIAALEGERELLVALGKRPGQLRALFIQGAFEDDRGRLDLQAHGITIDRDYVNWDGRALIEAVKLTGVSARVRFRHGHDQTKLLPARFKRTLPRTFKVFRRRRHYGCLLAALEAERERLAALGKRPSQLRALFIQGAFEDDRRRLDLQTHCITIDRDCVNRDGRALIEAV